MASSRVAAILQTMRILWLGLFVSHVLFLVMIAGGFVRGAQHETMPPHMPELFGALALGIAVFAVLFPARTFARALRNMNVPTSNEAGEAIGSFRESAPVRKVVADPEKAVLDAMPRFQTPFLFGLALAESISLFGFVIGFLGGPPYGWIPFFALGMLLAASKFPRITMITSAIENVTGARCEL